MRIITQASGWTLDAGLLEKASEADRRWFKNHPDRNYRIRRPMNGEPSGGCMIIEQIEPGVRIRRAIRTTGALPPDNDRALRRLLELLDEDRVPTVFGGEVIGFDELPHLGDRLQ